MVDGLASLTPLEVVDQERTNLEVSFCLKK